LPDEPAVIGQVAVHDRAGADKATAPDGNTLNDCGGSSNVRSITDGDRARQGHPGGNMHAFANAAVMVDASACIDDAIRTYRGIALDDRARHKLDALAQLRARANYG
jgi:hypothetical protein